MVKKDESFPKTVRLRSPKEFEAAMSGVKTTSGCLSSRSLWNDKEARLGLIVGARYEPLSPRRQFLKRVAREYFRSLKDQLPPVDIALRLAKKGPKDESMADFKIRISQDMKGLFEQCLKLTKPLQKEISAKESTALKPVSSSTETNLKKVKAKM